ncbi:MAG: ATP-grasp domain-containing protein, partial [Bacteroidales bacterium]|nr:ATP-grasp domain-containing protein [Bacteroidales bacterium]
MKKEDRLIEVIATDIADLAMMGFGSIKNCRSVYNALIEKYTHVNFNIVRTKSDLEKIVYWKPDLVFTGIKYVIFNGIGITKNREDKIWISEYMEEAEINYTGSGKDAMELEFSKDEAKKRVEEFGINTASYFVAKPGVYNTEDELPINFPLFIKPLREGDGKGIGSDSVVYDFESYEKKIQDIYTIFKQSALVEKFISGREFTVSILGSDSNGEPIAMPVEIIVSDKNSGSKILGYKTKNENKEKVIAIDDKDIYQSVISIAKNAFIALGARDYGRIDIIMDDEDCPYFLEANLVPGMTHRPSDIDCSYFPR